MFKRLILSIAIVASLVAVPTASAAQQDAVGTVVSRGERLEISFSTYVQDASWISYSGTFRRTKHGLRGSGMLYRGFSTESVDGVRYTDGDQARFNGRTLVVRVRHRVFRATQRADATWVYDGSVR